VALNEMTSLAFSSKVTLIRSLWSPLTADTQIHAVAPIHSVDIVYICRYIVIILSTFDCIIALFVTV